MPQPPPSQIELGVIEVLKAVRREPIQPTLDSDLVVDLGFDSLRILEVIAELEDRFDISIPLNDLPSLRTVTQIAAHVAALVERSRRGQMTVLRTLPEALAEAARTDKSFLFVVDGIETRYSFAELRLASLGVARALREAGLRPGDLVALVIGDSAQFLTTLCGASLAGVIPASLYPPVTAGNPSAYREATARIIRLAGARAIVTTSALHQQFDDMRASCPTIDVVLSAETLQAPPREPDHTTSLDDIALVQFTSGSTAVPKGVMLTHRNLSANIGAINGPAGLGASAADTALSWLPLYHDMGLIGMALGPLYCGRPAVLLTPQAFARRPAEWLRAISRHRATISFAPNFAYALCVRRMKDRDLEGLDLSSWRVAGCGGEPIHAPTVTAFAERFAPVGFRETSFLPSYGLAEHVLAATFSPARAAPAARADARGRLARMEPPRHRTRSAPIRPPCS